MRQGVLGIVIFFAMGWLGSLPAAAHVVEGDGSIQAMLQVAPRAAAGEPSVLRFQFFDAAGGFTGEECECVVSIQRGRREIHSQLLFLDDEQADPTAFEFSFVFPEPDVYEIYIQGKPRGTGMFSPFTYHEVVVVGRTPSPGWVRYVEDHLWHEGKPAAHAIHIAGAGLVVAVFGGMVLQERVKKYL